jgi:CheY-like chemotaxis protein
MTRVLIVDDDHDTADSYAVLITLWGHETRKAYDGESVLQQALAFQPHVVMLDIGLPKLDGYDVARKLRQYQLLVGTKIVAVTGRATATDQQRAQEAGFDEFFAKPITSEVLKSYLEQFNAPIDPSSAPPH